MNKLSYILVPIKNRSILIGIIFLSWYQLHAQEQYRAVHWGEADGLRQERWHNAIIKDVNGFMWFGSGYSELCRFDGNTFKQYKADNRLQGSIRGTQYFTFVEDSLHHIWIGTNQGISRYDITADTFTNFSIFVDSSTRTENAIPFWATQEEVFCIESQSRITAYHIHTLAKKELLTIDPADKVGTILPRATYTIFDSASNSVWFLPQNKEGLVQYELSGGKVTHHNRPLFWKQPSRYNWLDSEVMRYDKKRNCIWIHSHDGLARFGLADRKFMLADAWKSLVNENNYGRWHGLDLDPQGRLWLSTQSNGIMIYNPDSNTIRSPFPDTSLQHEIGDQELKIYCDRDGMVWISYVSIKGIYQLIPYYPVVQRYQANKEKPDSLSSLNILRMVPDDYGNIWIGTGDEGLNIYNPRSGSFRSLKEKDMPGLKGKGIWPIAVDNLRNKAWINAFLPDRIYEMNLKTNQCNPILFKGAQDEVLLPLDIFNFNLNLEKNAILFKDAGYGVFELKVDSPVARLIIPMKDHISKMIIGEGQQLFIQTNRSITNLTYRKVNETWVRTPHFLDSLKWSDIFYVPKDQTYWVSIPGFHELILFDRDFRILRKYDDEQGLMNEIVDVIPDNNANLWFNNSDRQIGWLNSTSGIISLLSAEDGYHKQLFDFTLTASPVESGGELYFVGSTSNRGKNVSLDRISPDKYVPSTLPEIYINTIQIHHEDKPSIIHGYNLNELHLLPDENKISIETGIMNFYSNSKSQIRYKLEANGKKGDWEYAPPSYVIRYEELPHGIYTLLLQAGNANNEFKGPIKRLQIMIATPWWKSLGFRILVVLISLGILFGYARYRADSLLKKNQLLEEKISVRTSELNNSLKELKAAQNQIIQSEKMASLGVLTSGIAHEIKNPLNFINNFSEINQELITEIEEDQIPVIYEPQKSQLVHIIKNLKKNSEKINLHGKRIDGIVKGMLQHSRLGNSVKEAIQINKLCEESIKLAYQGFRSKEQSFHASYETHFEPDLPKIMIIPQDMGRVILNVLNNAFYTVHKKYLDKETAADQQKELQHDGSSNSLHLESFYKPTVIIKTHQADQKIFITISDNGVGINPSVLGKIFQPFFTTKPTGEGTGLGLSMAYDIVIQGHGGELLVKSKEGIGSDVEIALPLNSPQLHLIARDPFSAAPDDPKLKSGTQPQP